MLFAAQCCDVVISRREARGKGKSNRTEKNRRQRRREKKKRIEERAINTAHVIGCFTLRSKNYIKSILLVRRKIFSFLYNYYPYLLKCFFTPVQPTMFPAHSYARLRKTRSRRRRSQTKQHHLIQSKKSDHRTTIDSSSVDRFHQIVSDLKRPGSRFSSYTIKQLEPICQQIAIQQMSSTTSVSLPCPFICIFCQNLIYEPITLYCGHTFCNRCIKDEQLSSNINCPRCPPDIQGQIQSSIVHAREKSYRTNRFLQQLLEHSEILKPKCEMILLCHKGQIEYSKGNYQQAIDIYTQIIDQCKKKNSSVFLLFHFI